MKRKVTCFILIMLVLLFSFQALVEVHAADCTPRCHYVTVILNGFPTLVRICVSPCGISIQLVAPN